MTKPSFLQSLDSQAEKVGYLRRVSAVVPPPLQLPSVLLPGGSQSITQTAIQFGELLGPAHTVFSRGGVPVTVRLDALGSPVLEPVRPAAMASIFETVAQLTHAVQRRGTTIIEPSICSEQTAKLIQHSPAFLGRIPPIRAVSRCPVLVAGPDGQLEEIHAYDDESGILAMGAAVPEVSLDQSKQLLRQVLAGFWFASPGDEARALAAIITPSLIKAGLIAGRAPLDLGEADESQSGKGYRNKLTAAIYGERVRTFVQTKRGVGGADEAFNRLVIGGAGFIAFDNVRGAVDSPALESFLTEDIYHARALRVDATIDPRPIVVMLTSNKADATVDLINRSSCVRILKQPPGHQFTLYPEGDILAHVRAHHSRYLGAVFTVVRAWWDAGRPSTHDTRHDFREWVGVLDWICRNLLGTVPIMDGHSQTQIRITTPHLNWLRDVALVVRRARRTGMWLRTSDLVEVMDLDGAVVIPGLRDDADITDQGVRKSILQAVGRRLAQCFKAGDEVTVDGIVVTRQVVQVERARSFGGSIEAKEYRFTSTIAPDTGPTGIETAPKRTSSRTDAPKEDYNPAESDKKECRSGLKDDKERLPGNGESSAASVRSQPTEAEQILRSRIMPGLDPKARRRVEQMLDTGHVVRRNAQGHIELTLQN